MELNQRIKEFGAHYYEWGDSNKTTIVCLHGLGNSGAAFLEVAECLEDHYQVLSFDNPGHGCSLSFETEEDYQFSNLVTWYDNVFQEVLTEPFYILGHSWGTDIALHYAKQYPQKIKGVILLDGGYTFPDFQEDMTFSKIYNGWNNYMNNYTVFDTWEDVKKEYKRHTNRWNENIEQMVSSLFNKNGQYEFISSKFTVLSIIKAFFKESFLSTYPYIKAPLLLINATLPKEFSTARNNGITQLKHDINDVTIVSMKETNHMVHWEKPEEIANEVYKWVNKS